MSLKSSYMVWNRIISTGKLFPPPKSEAKRRIAPKSEAKPRIADLSTAASGHRRIQRYIVGQTYIDSVPVPFYPLCCVTDVVCYRPSSVSSTQLEVQAHVDDRVLSCHLAGL